MTPVDALESLMRWLAYLPPAHQERVERAAAMAVRAHEGQERADGTPYVLHLFAVAEILAEWRADGDTIIAGLLHDTLEDTDLSRQEIEDSFGPDVIRLVEGVTKFTQADLGSHDTLDRKVETIRKLLDVMRVDIRVIIIKLADRAHNVQTIHALPPLQRRKFARETLQVYAKFAEHLGMSGLRRQLAETCIPLEFEEEANILVGMRRLAEGEAENALHSIERDLLDHPNAPRPIPLVRLDWRALDTLLTLYRKRELTKDDTYTIILTAADAEGCYALLQFLHTLYRPISGKFRDYIGSPTQGGYRSLHTTVVGPNGSPLLIRIRTATMDDEARLGLAMQLGKQGGEGAANLAWLQRSASLDTDTKQSSADFWQALQSDIFPDALQVTVDGEAIFIPAGATVLDAVYARHASAANTLMAVEQNGHSVTLGNDIGEESVLRTSLGTDPHVSHAWLDMITTRYARGMIVDALKQRSRQEKLTLGQRLVQRELDHFKKGLLGTVTRVQQEMAAKRFQRVAFEDVIAMVGEGVLQAREVVFALFPDTEISRARGKMRAPYDFRLLIRGTVERRQDILPLLSTVAASHEVDVLHTDLRLPEGSTTFHLWVRCRAPDARRFADVVGALERQEWTSSVQTLVSHRQWFLLLLSFFAAFSVIVFDVLFLPHYLRLAHEQSLVIQLLPHLLPLLPVLGVNYYLLWLLRKYVVRMRSDRWFLGVGFILNIVGFLAVLAPAARAPLQGGVLPVVALFAVSMILMSYRFFQTEALFKDVDRTIAHPLSTMEWTRKKRRKLAGYALRLAAVTLWGLQPLYIKYTSATDVNIAVRIFLIWAGIFLVATAGILLRWLLSKGKLATRVKLKVPITKEFVGIIVGYTFFMYFLNASLEFTTSTNFILLNNFSPVLALFVAAVLWRHSIPYLREPKTMLWIFLTFLMGSTGSSLIIFYDSRLPDSGAIWGDMLALLAMLADTLLAISQIRYMKLASKTSSLAVNLHVSLWLMAISAPFVVLSIALNPSIFHLPVIALVSALGVGILTGIGQILNYETYRRIDGFIAFLMFNISILITFMVEVFFLGKLSPTWVLLIGGVSIIGSTVFAEIINSRAEKRGL